MQAVIFVSASSDNLLSLFPECFWELVCYFGRVSPGAMNDRGAGSKKLGDRSLARRILFLSSLDHQHLHAMDSLEKGAIALLGVKPGA